MSRKILWHFWSHKYGMQFVIPSGNIQGAKQKLRTLMQYGYHDRFNEKDFTFQFGQKE